MLAWQKLRWEQRRQRSYTMGEALKHAWAWFKGAADREAQRIEADAAWAASGRRITQLRSPVHSPIRRSLAGTPYAGATDYRAAYATARLGS